MGSPENDVQQRGRSHARGNGSGRGSRPNTPPYDGRPSSPSPFHLPSSPEDSRSLSVSGSRDLRCEEEFSPTSSPDNATPVTPIYVHSPFPTPNTDDPMLPSLSPSPSVPAPPHQSDEPSVSVSPFLPLLSRSSLRLPSGPSMPLPLPPTVPSSPIQEECAQQSTQPVLIFDLPKQRMSEHAMRFVPLSSSQESGEAESGEAETTVPVTDVPSNQQLPNDLSESFTYASSLATSEQLQSDFFSDAFDMGLSTDFDMLGFSDNSEFRRHVTREVEAEHAALMIGDFGNEDAGLDFTELCEMEHLLPTFEPEVFPEPSKPLPQVNTVQQPATLEPRPLSFEEELLLAAQQDESSESIIVEGETPRLPEFRSLMSTIPEQTPVLAPTNEGHFGTQR